MKLRLNPNHRRLALYVAGVTLVWGIVGLPWVVAPAMVNFSGIGSDSGVERVHSRFPSFLVDPATLAGGDDLLVFMPWLVAELKLRFALVTGSWLLGIALIWLVHRQRHRSEVTGNR